MAIAKGLGAGFPVGACLATAEASAAMTAGTHGSTFGGNPLAMAVANAVLDVILAEGFLAGVRRVAGVLNQRIGGVAGQFPHAIGELRGTGLLLGLLCEVPNTDLIAAAVGQRSAAGPGGRQRRAFAPPPGHQRRPRGRGGCRPRGRLPRTGAMSTPRHFLDLDRLVPEDLRGILADSARLKLGERRGGVDPAGSSSPLAGKLLAMIFEKPSTRTRVSFHVAMRQLGGETIVLEGNEMQLGRGETVADTARVLSRYVDAIMVRSTKHASLLEMAEHASVPVINGLTNFSHPCQVMADVLTFEGKSRPHRWPGAGMVWGRQ